MKINKVSIGLILGSFLIALIFAACEDEVLNKVPKDKFSDAAVWKDESLINMFVTDVFTGVNGYAIGVEGYDDWVDCRSVGDINTGDIFDHQKAVNVTTWLTGDYSPSGGGDARIHLWTMRYRYIRKCNLFLENISQNESIPEDKKNRLIGEVRFLRAYFYHELVATFGGVPLVTNAFAIDDDLQLPRNSYEDCINFIVSELDDILDLLPDELSANELGRINKAAVYALKSRALLYANSALHNPKNTEAPRGPLYDYTKNTMQDAANAAKAVIDMSQFNLPKVNDFKQYQRLFIEHNKEQIWVKVNSVDYYSNLGFRQELANSSPGFFGWGMLGPTHNFVQSFQMANGKSIYDPTSGYDPSPEHIYDNREMRFYSNVLYHGCEYKGRTMTMHLPDGIDYKNNTQPWNGCPTRYYQRKILDENVVIGTQGNKTCWPKFRLAEMYLNYAEANYFLGNEAITREYINKVRERVKLPPLETATTGTALFDALVYENHMEFHNENHWFFDVRRWLIADKTENENMTGIEWFRVKPSFNAATDDMANEANWVKMSQDGKYVYREIVVQKRKHPKRQLYYPIPQSEIYKDTKLVQNEGYN